MDDQEIAPEDHSHIAIPGPVRPSVDRFFYPDRATMKDPGKRLIGEIQRMLQNYEEYYATRKRRRRPSDQLSFERTVEAVICDLLHAHFHGHTDGIAITRSKRDLTQKSRYRAAALNKALPTILDLMLTPEMAFVTQELGYWSPFFNRKTKVRASKRLIRKAEEFKVSADDIGESLVGETIILKSEKTSGPRPKSEFLEYDDTDTTRRYRAEVEEINAWLAHATIAFDEAELFRSASIDVNRRKLRRIFANGDFTSGGRLFGGFWLELKREERLEGLSIGGEQVVALDFGQMNVRLAYARAKVEPPAGDLYSIPGLEGCREGVKSFFNAMLSADKPIKRKPGDMVDLLPKEMTARRIREAVTQAHPDIAHLFGQGVGLHLMFIESEIMVRTLLSLKEKGVVALPIHDSVAVGRSHEGKARDAMHAAFQAYTGMEAVIKVDR